MPGYLLNMSTPVLCAHGGQAKASAAIPRVKVMGQPVVVKTIPHLVAGCPNVTPAGAPLPCVTVQWLTGAIRVKVVGQPVLLADSKGLATETGTPVSIVPAQMRVQGI